MLDLAFAWTIYRVMTRMTRKRNPVLYLPSPQDLHRLIQSIKWLRFGATLSGPLEKLHSNLDKPPLSQSICIPIDTKTPPLPGAEMLQRVMLGIEILKFSAQVNILDIPMNLDRVK